MNCAIQLVRIIMASPPSLHMIRGGKAVSAARARSGMESNFGAFILTVYLVERGRRHVWRLYIRHETCLRRSWHAVHLKP